MQTRILHQLGVFMVMQFNGDIVILARWTLVAMVTIKSAKLALTLSLYRRLAS